jgi:LSD1 subclass zinc finger protein
VKGKLMAAFLLELLIFERSKCRIVLLKRRPLALALSASRINCSICESICTIHQDINPRWVFT